MTYSHIRQMSDSTPEETEKLRRRMAAQQAVSAEVLAPPEGAEPAQPSQNPQKSGESTSKPSAKAPAEPKSSDAGESPGQTAIKEVGAAVAGGAIDAVQGIGSNLNQAVRGLTGQEVKTGEDYTPSWLKLPDGVEPQNKTWWGSTIRGMVQLGALSVAAGRGGRAAGAKLGIGQAVSLPGKVGRSIATGAVAGNLSTFSTDNDNLTRQIGEVLPWWPQLAATQDDDSPLARRLKNTLEGAGFDVAFDTIAAAWRGRKLARNAEARAGNETLREQAIEAREEGSDLAAMLTTKREARAAMDVAKVARDAAKGTEMEAEAVQAFTAAQDAHKAALRDYNAARKARTPAEVERVATEDAMKENTALREANKTEAARYEYEQDPEFLNGPNPRSSHPDLFDDVEKGQITAKPNIIENTTKALEDAAKVAVDPTQAKGRLTNVLTEPKLKMINRGGSPAVKKIITEMEEALRSDRDFAVEINNLRLNKGQVINQVATQALKVLEVTANPEDLEGLKQVLLSDSWKGGDGTAPVEFMNRINTAATQLLIRVTGEEMADLANVYRSYEGTGIVSTDHLGSLLSDRLEFLMKQHKKAAYIRGSELQSMKKNWATQFIPGRKDYETAIRNIDTEVDEMMTTIRGTLKDGDPRLLNHFITAASISDGNVRTMDDLANYFRKKIGMNGWRLGSPEDQGYMLRGLTSTFYNSVLSSPVTTLRAWTGTGLATILRPTTMMLGGAMRGDGRIVAKSFAQFHALQEGFGEALTMFKKSSDAWLGGTGTLNPNIADSKAPFHKTDEFKALKEWAELDGNAGDKLGVKWAEQLSAFNAHWAVNYTMGLMDAGDSFFRTLIGRMELRGQAFDEAWYSNGGKVDANFIRKYETDFRSRVFDEDGVITDIAARMGGDEVSLTTPLTGVMGGITEVVQSAPLLRPFVMFPKTAINAATLLSTYTPILNGFVKEVDDIMNATMETAPRIMQQYGITDLAAAQASLEGRVALGNIVVAAAAAMYLKGAVTGNGPADRTTRELWQAQGWEPRSVRVGDTWISYNGLEPFHTFLALTADIGDNLGDLGESVAMDGFAKLGFIVAQNATNKTFLNGLSPLLDILSGQPTQSATTLTAQTLNNSVPYAGLRNYMSQMIQPGLREVNDSIWDKIRNRNPILRQQLPAQRDPLDGSLVKSYDPLTNIFNRTSPYAINADWGETREKLRQSGFDVKTSLTTGLLGEKLDKADKAAIHEEMGQENILGQLKGFFASADYKKWDAKLRRERELGVPAEVSGLQQNWHLIEIQNIFDNAKRNAMQRHYAKTGETQAVRDAQLKKARSSAAEQGDITPSLQNIMNVSN